jgi:hypothetical protein
MPFDGTGGTFVKKLLFQVAKCSTQDIHSLHAMYIQGFSTFF